MTIAALARYETVPQASRRFDGLGDALLRLRKRAGLTQTRAALAAFGREADQPRIARYETETGDAPNLSTLDKLLRAYGASIGDLFRELSGHVPEAKAQLRRIPIQGGESEMKRQLGHLRTEGIQCMAVRSAGETVIIAAVLVEE